MGTWFKIGGKLINLDQYKEIYLTKTQFGSKCIVIDGNVIPDEHSEEIFKKIQQTVLQRGR